MNRTLASAFPLLVAGCPAFSPGPLPCRTNGNCPTGHGCSPEGVCTRGIEGVSGARVVVTPSRAVVVAGNAVQFTATVDGDPQAMDWSVDGTGTIASDGIYTAPGAVPDPDVETVRAALAGEPTVTGTAVAVIVAKYESPVPVVLSLSPASALVRSPTLTLTLDGGGFAGSTGIKWNGSPLSTSWVSATRVTAVVAASRLAAAGTASVTAETPAPGGGTSNPQTFAVENPLPTISSIAPAAVAKGSADFTLQVNGSGFEASSAVYLDAVMLATTRVGATKLTAQVPASEAATGRVAAVAVQTPAPGGGTSNAETLTVNNPSATAVSLSPQSALAGSGAVTLTLTGMDFAPGITVTFRGQAVTPTVNSATQLTATVPASLLSAWGPAAVTARNAAPGGGGTGSLAFRVDPVIRTVAGGYTGEGGPAVDAALTRVSRTALGPGGEIFFTDCHRHRVMKIEASGVLRAVAGTGIAGFSGDNGPALQARLYCPQGISVDASGNLYVVDFQNFRIRRISNTGDVTTFAGNGAYSYSGDGGSAAAAAIGSVYDVKVTANGTVYLSACEGGGHRVRRVTTAGTIDTIAGTGVEGYNGDGMNATAAQLNCPRSLAYNEATGDLFVAEWGGSRVRRINSANTIYTHGGKGSDDYSGDGGQAVAAGIGRPNGLALDSAGNLYFGQYFHNRIRRECLKLIRFCGHPTKQVRGVHVTRTEEVAAKA